MVPPPPHPTPGHPSPRKPSCLPWRGSAPSVEPCVQGCAWRALVLFFLTPGPHGRLYPRRGWRYTQTPTPTTATGYARERTTTNYGKVRPLLPAATCPSLPLPRLDAGSSEGVDGTRGARTQVLCPAVSLWSSADEVKGQVGRALGFCSSARHPPWQAWAGGDIVSCLIDLGRSALWSSP